MSRRLHFSQGHSVQWPVATTEQAVISKANPKVGVTASPAVLMGSEVLMDDTSDLPPCVILAYRCLPNARVSGDPFPQPLMGKRKRKLTGPGVQDNRFAKQPNINTSPNAQSGPSHKVRFGVTVPALADSITVRCIRNGDHWGQ
ncbi:hypothetical protein H4582DRAFT_2059336 [Lactarius indigo]|nr:hypothetical protein H4582DRAFT_2066611 [Lactarius indigo]KAI9429194.1 hypothetical protein H4582DRAFT_2065669 [Lactarius indigo]KAI9435871.1 hypothetical protein H4582DRAFT_2059336 [Lactarius indigo]